MEFQGKTVTPESRVKIADNGRVKAVDQYGHLLPRQYAEIDDARVSVFFRGPVARSREYQVQFWHGFGQFQEGLKHRLDAAARINCASAADQLRVHRKSKLLATSAPVHRVEVSGVYTIANDAELPSGCDRFTHMLGQCVTDYAQAIRSATGTSKGRSESGHPAESEVLVVVVEIQHKRNVEEAGYAIAQDALEDVRTSPYDIRAIVPASFQDCARHGGQPPGKGIDRPPAHTRRGNMLMIRTLAVTDGDSVHLVTQPGQPLRNFIQSPVAVVQQIA